MSKTLVGTIKSEFTDAQSMGKKRGDT